MNYQSILVLCLFVLFSCKVTSETEADTTNAKPSLMLKYSKGPCFGECPVFDMSVDTDGTLSYKGIRFTKKQGLHRKKLSEARLKALKASIKKAKIWEKEAKYSSGLVDIQKTTIQYFEGDKPKTIKADGNSIPEELQELFKSLDLIANSSGWELVEKPNNGNQQNTAIIDNEIIVQLKKNVKLEEWLSNYSAYNLRLKDKISPSLNMWLLQFDKTKIDPQQLLRQIKTADGIVNAEFNKNLNQRN